MGVCPPAPAGPVGAPGPQGNTGSPGAPGTNGVDGTNGINGANCWEAVNGTTVMDCIGPQGEKGDKGDQGDPGICDCSANVTTTELTVNGNTFLNGNVTCAAPIDTVSCLGTTEICRDFSLCDSIFNSITIQSEFAIGLPGADGTRNAFFGFNNGISPLTWFINAINGYANSVRFFSNGDSVYEALGSGNLFLRGGGQVSVVSGTSGVSITSGAGPANNIAMTSGNDVTVSATGTYSSAAVNQLHIANTDYQINFGGLFRIFSTVLGADVFTFDGLNSVLCTDGTSPASAPSITIGADLRVNNDASIIKNGGGFQTIGPGLEVCQLGIRSSTSRLPIGNGTGFPGTNTVPSVIDMRGIIRNEESIGGSNITGAPLVFNDVDGADFRNTCLTDTFDNILELCPGTTFQLDTFSATTSIMVGTRTISDVAGQLRVDGTVNAASIELEVGPNMITLQPGAGNDLVINDGTNLASIAVTATGIQVLGDIDATGDVTATGACCTSDMRAKEDVKKVSPADSFRMVRELDVINYRFKPWFENQTSIAPGTRFDGVVAQQLDKHFPQAIYKRKRDVGDGSVIDDFHHVRKDELVPHLLNAIKFLGARVEESGGAGLSVAAAATQAVKAMDGRLKRQSRDITALRHDLDQMSLNYRSSLEEMEKEIEQRAKSMAEGVIAQYFGKLDAMDKSLRAVEKELGMKHKRTRDAANQEEPSTAELQAIRSVADLMRHLPKT